MSQLPAQEASSRLKEIQRIIADTDADACVITSSVNQYYLLSYIFDGYLYVMREGEPYLFVKRPSNIKGERVKPVRKPELIPALLREVGVEPPKRVLLETDQLSYSAAVRLQAALEMPEVSNASGELRKARMVKSEYELEQMRESARVHAKVYETIPSLYRKGMTDL